MLQSFKKSFQLILVLFLFSFSLLIIPADATETIKFDSYQRIKNITRKDPSVGVIYTMGQPSDTIKHLIFVYNQNNYERDYQITVTLPRYLELIPYTTNEYIEGWKSRSDINEDFQIHLRPFESRYYRFSTKLSGKFPNENAILTTMVEIKEDSGQALTSTTKVYVPNYQTSEELSEDYRGLNAKEQERIKKLLEEEKQLMEEQFLRLMENNPVETGEWPEEDQPAKEGSNLWIYLITLIILSISIYTYLRKRIQNIGIGE